MNDPDRKRNLRDRDRENSDREWYLGDGEWDGGVIALDRTRKSMFADSKRRLRRAQQHLNNLEGAIVGFLKAQPYVFRVEKEDDPTSYLLYGRITRRPRHIWGLWIGEIANGARCALDYAVYELSTLPQGDKFRSKLQFPICDTNDAFANACSGHQLDGVDPTLRRIVEQHQPFNGTGGATDDPLSLLREISIADKHHAVHVVAAAGEHATIKIGGMNFSARGGARIRLGEWAEIQQLNLGRMTEAENVVGRLTFSSNPCGITPKPVIEIQVGPGCARIERRHVVLTLRAILSRVGAVLSDLEASRPPQLRP